MDTNLWFALSNLPVALDILHAQALAGFLRSVFMSLVDALGMRALIFVASACGVLIADQVKFDLDERNPIAAAGFEVNKGNLNHIVLAVLVVIGGYGRTNNLVQRGLSTGGNILCYFLANNVGNGRSKSSVVTIDASCSLLLLAAKSVMVVLAIGQLTGVDFTSTIDSIVLNSVYKMRLRDT